MSATAVLETLVYLSRQVNTMNSVQLAASVRTLANIAQNVLEEQKRNLPTTPAQMAMELIRLHGSNSEPTRFSYENSSR